ncbi:hypothetical protein D3C73_654830 [compost metagenome]
MFCQQGAVITGLQQPFRLHFFQQANRHNHRIQRPIAQLIKQGIRRVTAEMQLQVFLRVKARAKQFFISQQVAAKSVRGDGTDLFTG